MADAIKVKVDGLKQIEDKLLRLIPKKAQQKVLRRGLRKAGNPMLQHLRAGARRGKSNSLSIAMRVWNVKKGQTRITAASVEMGPKRSDKRAIAAYWSFYTGQTPTPAQFLNGIRHGHLVEWGTKHSPAKPFMRPGFDANARTLIARFQKIMGKEIELEAAKGVTR